MAHAGLCSRREAEAWILAGRVLVNGKKLTTPAHVLTEGDEVSVDGKIVGDREKPRLWLYHKPKGLVTTHRDPKLRPTVFASLPKDLPRVVSVGRLDLNSEGLLLLTNYGPLARYFELPSTGLTRAYRVRVFGRVPLDLPDRVRQGITIDRVNYGAIDVEIDKGAGRNTWLFVKLREGKNREIRKIMQHFDLQVNRLLRVAYGPFELGSLPPGALQEVDASVIRRVVGNVVGSILPSATGAQKERVKSKPDSNPLPAKLREGFSSSKKIKNKNKTQRDKNAHRRRKT